MADATNTDLIPDHVATADQYREALLAIRPNLTDKMLTMLQLQYRAPDRTATAQDLAQAVGYATFHPANRQYGELGRLIAESLKFTPPKRTNGTPRYWSTLSTGDPALDGRAQGQFVMRPELAAAVADLRWA